MKNTLKFRITFFSFIFLFILIFCLSAMEIVEDKREYVNILVLRAQNIGNSMKSYTEKVVGLGLELKDVSGISEKCRELVGNNPEITYCIVTDPTGRYLFLNNPVFLQLQLNDVTKTITTKDRRVARIIGSPHQYYDTVTDAYSADGKLSAIIHVGFPLDSVYARLNTKIVRSCFVLVAALLGSFSFLVIFVNRSILKPIASLLEGVKMIARGAFDTKIEEVPIYEFNQLAKNINFMSESLRSRDEEIQRNYRDLAGTHEELRESYQKLENLSHELERSEHLYKSLMEDSGDAILLIGSDEIIRMVNKMAEDLFGYSSAEVAGLQLTKLLLLLNVENIPRIHALFRKSLAGEHVSEEMQFTRKNGETILARVNMSTSRSGNQFVAQAIFRDITKERETLLNLGKSAADLARLNKMKDSFLGLASHELKTPLTVIMGYAELIMSDMADQIDSTVLEMVENISNAAVRLDAIVKDMVDLSMIDEKRLRLKLEDINMNRLVDEAVNELRFFFNMRHQELVVNLDESIPPIRGDSIRLMQLLSNVLGNAIKFTPDGGAVTVTTSAKYIVGQRGPDIGHSQLTAVTNEKENHIFVEITISDTGIGIDSEDKIRIFEKFYEAGKIEEHSTGKVAFKAKGAGLGLAIAKGIVEMHGGEIWVESAGYSPEKFPGSTFHILLPLNPLAVDATIEYMNII
ncbi:ATP-binding protein [Geobacter sp. OR-1]|uniref:ATP-binding protein n=1 Tax=Geobacter sp. OR-1 TaxID=1266765 RepID=UPI0005A898C0|nr:ATP-binding protein [Geobacter sp. OR-1]